MPINPIKPISPKSPNQKPKKRALNGGTLGLPGRHQAGVIHLPGSGGSTGFSVKGLCCASTLDVFFFGVLRALYQDFDQFFFNRVFIRVFIRGLKGSVRLLQGSYKSPIRYRGSVRVL